MSLSKFGGSEESDPSLYSSQQNPLLLPTVLDIILPYLTFPDLKTSRLVCSIWDAIALPLIGSKKLKPINFFQIPFEDFLALKSEFKDVRMTHPKLKLFQGFVLNWEQVSTMAYCNFMASFHPSQIIISGNDVADPSASLKMLLSPTVGTLTHLHLEINWDKISSFNLETLVGLGMKLKSLHLDIRQDNEFQDHDTPLIWGLGNLLWSQASNLEELWLQVGCRFVEGDVYDEASLIELPIFPQVHTLHFSTCSSATRIGNSGYHGPMGIFKEFLNAEIFPNVKTII